MDLREFTERVQDRVQDTSTGLQSVIRDKINETLEAIQMEAETASWYYRETSFSTIAQKTSSSDSVRVVNGSPLVFFSTDANVGKSFEGANLKVGTDSNSYRVMAIGLPEISVEFDLDGAAEASTSLYRYAMLDRPYEGTSAATASYTLTQDIYRLRSDVHAIKWMVNHELPQDLVFIDPELMRCYVPDPHNQGAAGISYSAEDLGRESVVWISQYSDDGTTGAATATVVNNSPRVLLEGLDARHDQGDYMYGVTTRDELLPGLGFQFATDEKVYIIQSVELDASPTSGDIYLTLEERYNGTGATTANFRVGLFDAPVVRLYSVPTGANRFSYGYWAKEKTPLVHDEDTPYLPRQYHPVVVDGAISRMQGLLESRYIAEAERRYQKGLEKIMSSAGRRREVPMLRDTRVAGLRRRPVNLGPYYPRTFAR